MENSRCASPSSVCVIHCGFQIYYHLQTPEYQAVIQSAVQQQKLPAGFYYSIVVVYAHIASYLYFAYGAIISYRQELQQRFSQLKSEISTGSCL